MNDKLYSIAYQASETLLDLIKNHADEILEDWHTVEAEAQFQSEKPKRRLMFTVTLDNDNLGVTHSLRWTITKVREVESEIPDPAQMELIAKTSI